MPPPSTSVNWLPVVVGGGGLTTHLSISNDGETILTCGDVNGVWLFNSTTERWESLQEPLRGTPLYLESLNPGLFHNSQGPTDVRVAPSDSDRIYYFLKPATIDASVSKTYLMRSDDRGQTFTATAYVNDHYADTDGNAAMGGNSAGKFKYPKIGIDPDNPDVLYVPFPGTGNKPRMSVDGGDNFTEISGLPTQVANTIGAVSWAIDPSSDVVSGRHQRIICFMHLDGIYETTDGGTNWTEILDLPTALFNDCGAFGPDGTYYVAIHNDGVYRYKDETWTEILNSVTNVKIAVHPTTAGRIAILVPSSAIRHSVDHGDTFATHAVSGFTYTSEVPWQEDQQAGLKFATGNVRAIAWNPAVTDELWVCSAQGICRGTVNASAVSTWEVPVLGIEELVGNEVVHIQGKSHINLFNWDEGGFIKTSTVEGLAEPPEDKHGPPAIAGWEGLLYNIWQASVDPQNTNRMVVSGNKRIPFTLAGNGYSLDGGLTFSDYSNLPGPVTGTGQFQQVCINDGVTLWIDSHNSANTKLPMRTEDFGETEWTQLTLDNFPGHTGAADSGFGIGLPLQMRLMAADAVDPDVFYLNNRNTVDRVNLAGIWRSTDRGQNFTYLPGGSGTPGSGTPLSNPWFNNSLIAGRVLKAVPGKAGHLVMCPFGTSGPTFPAAGFTFVQSTNGGESWSVIDPDILSVETFGFGKARTNGGYPTIFFAGYYQGYWGIYRITDNDPTSLVRLMDAETEQWPVGIHSPIQNIEGDKDVYGRCYIAFGNSGFAYGGDDSPARSGASLNLGGDVFHPHSPAMPERKKQNQEKEKSRERASQRRLAVSHLDTRDQQIIQALATLIVLDGDGLLN